MKEILSVCSFLLVTRVISGAATCDEYVAQGRVYLAAHDLTNANNQFAAAVAQCPSHTNGNVFWAATRLLTLADQPAGKDLLNRLGFAATNRSVYGWTAKLPHDTNGVPQAPTNMSAAELTAFLRTNVLAQLIGTGTNLALVTDTNYTLALTSNETTTVAVTLDYGDLLLLRAGGKFAEYAGYTVYSWNVDAQLAAFRGLFTNGTATAEGFLAQYTNLLKFATTNDLAAAKLAFSNAVTLYLSASDFIRNRPTNITRLFNYDASMAQKEANFRSALTDLRQSLSTPTVFSLNTNLTMNVSNHFTGRTPPRAFFPQVAGDRIVAGTLPDPTFGGIVQGLAPYQEESFLGQDRQGNRRLRFISHFRSPQRLANGRIQVTLDGLEQGFFLIEVSTDLKTWNNLTTGTVQQGTISFVDSNSPSASRRFYRAVDYSGGTVVNGTVLDAATGAPVPYATVGLSFPYAGIAGVTNQADSSGNYFLALVGSSPYSYNYQLDVTASGYMASEVTGYFPYVAGEGGRYTTAPLYVAPIGYHPPNDYFAQRQTITGVNVTVTGFNFGATNEPGEPFFPYNAFQTVWWSWTAPADGAVVIDTTGSSFSTVLAVYTGDDLSSLTPVANSSSGGNGGSQANFFVTAGTSYQISVDRSYYGMPGRIVLHLYNAPPVPPSFTSQPYAQLVSLGGYAYLSAQATGTEPLSYQWWKDGAPLAGETDQSYFAGPVQPADAGVYWLVASNAAGSATSGPGILTVTGFPPPNDAFSNRVAISGLSLYTSGVNVGATKELGEPNHAGYPGGASVWWTWTAPTNGPVTLGVSGGSFDTLLAVYTGSSVANLVLVASDDNGGYNLGSQLTFTATKGTSYQMAVDGKGGATGNIYLNLSQVPTLVRPALQAARAGHGVVLSWPMWADNYMLETSTAASGGAWIALTNGVVLSADTFVLTNNVNSAAAFFRLHQR